MYVSPVISLLKPKSATFTTWFSPTKQLRAARSLCKQRYSRITTTSADKIHPKLLILKKFFSWSIQFYNSELASFAVAELGSQIWTISGTQEDEAFPWFLASFVSLNMEKRLSLAYFSIFWWLSPYFQLYPWICQQKEFYNCACVCGFFKNINPH